MSSILIVDDEANIRSSLKGALAREGYQVEDAPSVAAARTLLREAYDVVLLDVWFPGESGLDLLAEIHENAPDTTVVMMSGHANVDTAVQATRLGAYDFLEKPLSYDKLLLRIDHGLERARLAQENRELREALLGENEIIGEAPVMQKLKEQIEIAAPTDGWVLITGENGTGKELVARWVHHRSKRAEGPFVAVNCAAIPEELIESELFGHEKGAFTGAIQKKRGRFEMANGGTIFLDEIGDMSLMTQAKILRILQEHRFERVGGTETIEVNVRVIAATNKDLQAEMSQGRFREDLFYRLNVIPFHVPALRERREDIPRLAERFLAEYAADAGRPPKSIAQKALAKLQEYPWPGNVRELQNLIERLVLMTPGEVIELTDLPPQVSSPDRERLLRASASADTLAEARAAFEREWLLEKLGTFGWNISRTAEAVGLARESLSRKLKSLRIDVDAERARDGE